MSGKDTPSKFQPLMVPKSPIASSPQKNLTGSIRVAKDLVANLFNTIQSWNEHHSEGAQYVKQIALIKSGNLKEYSPILEEHTNDLYTIVQKMKSIEKLLGVFSTQMRALDKVDRKSETLFLSLNTEALVELVETVVDAYSREFKMKELVLENIAHSRNKDEVMFFATCWTLQTHITSTVNLKLETLLLETGHRKFS
ncbi:hypothetical protein JTB14_006714 [Gonioctena quinquepunctata]|nr:hypothetical protein JTB14_006714 [Gonioctena quinquepunctata]